MIQYIILALAFSFSGFLLGFGDSVRSSTGRKMSNVAGFIWLVGVIYGFWALGIVGGIYNLLGSFVLAAIFMNIGKKSAPHLKKKL
jgi:hypothetical protein